MRARLFHWTKMGRSWVAHVGNLSVSVRERGRRDTGLRWLVDDVLGWKHYGYEWHNTLDAAILEAEAVVVREALPALRKIVAARDSAAARSKKRSRP